MENVQNILGVIPIKIEGLQICKNGVIRFSKQNKKRKIKHVFDKIQEVNSKN